MGKQEEKHLNQRITNIEKRLHELSGEPRQQNSSTVQPQRTTDQEHDSAPRQTNIAPHITPAPIGAKEAKKRWYQTFKGWKDGLEVIAIFAGVWYAWTAYHQWTDSNRNFRIDQRPWVKIELVPSDPISQQVSITATTGSLLTIPVRAKNIGKTPAESVNATFAIQIAGKDDALYLPPDMTNPPVVANPKHKVGITKVNTGTIFPDQFHDWPISKVDDSKVGTSAPVALTQADVDRLRDGAAIVYVEGTVSYWDEFGTRHWTRFCTAIPKTNITQLSCVEYNRADNNY